MSHKPDVMRVLLRSSIESSFGVIQHHLQHTIDQLSTEDLQVTSGWVLESCSCGATILKMRTVELDFRTRSSAWVSQSKARMNCLKAVKYVAGPVLVLAAILAFTGWAVPQMQHML